MKYSKVGMIKNYMEGILIQESNYCK